MLLAIAGVLALGRSLAFTPAPFVKSRAGGARGISLFADHGIPPREPVKTDAYDEEQWSLYAAHSGKWEGVWTTFDGSIGGFLSEVEGVSEVSLVPEDAARHSMTVPSKDGGTRTIPVGTYTLGALGKQTLAGNGMVTGPSLLRSGLMSTELVLRHGASRLRVTIQHAPATPNEGSESNEPALLVFRVIVCRERCDLTGAPTRESEEERWRVRQPAPGSETTHFWRPVGPYAWRRRWGGRSATVTPRARAQVAGWEIEELDDEDAWHGRPRTGESSYTLQLPGGVLVQAPTLLTPGRAAQFRVAWLPCDELLLRAEATVVALEPDADEERFAPPRLLSLRYDQLSDKGFLPGAELVDMPNDDDDELDGQLR